MASCKFCGKKEPVMYCVCAGCMGKLGHQWISVQERLPEPNERVLVYRPDMKKADTGPISVQWGWTCQRKKPDVSHWMPLPEPPED